MSLIDKLKDIYSSESKIYNRLPEKLGKGIVESYTQKKPGPAFWAIAKGAINPYYEWKERGKNFYGTTIKSNPKNSPETPTTAEIKKASPVG